MKKKGTSVASMAVKERYVDHIIVDNHEVNHIVKTRYRLSSKYYAGPLIVDVDGELIIEGCTIG